MTTTTYDALYPGLTSVLVSAAAQVFDTDSAKAIDRLVTNAGRASAGRSPAAKKKVAMTEADALVAADKFKRPNGEMYYTRKWGEHDDVMVLRKAREMSSYILLYGAPGCGKTALIEAAYCDQPGGIETVLGSGDTEVSDLVGDTSRHQVVASSGRMAHCSRQRNAVAYCSLTRWDSLTLRVYPLYMDLWMVAVSTQSQQTQNVGP